MTRLIKKRILFFALFIFIAPYALYASESINQTSEKMQKVDYRTVPSPKRELLVRGYCRYHLPKEIYFIITCCIYDNPFKYRNKLLPNDLSMQDLSGFDFTNCKFTNTNLTDTNLDYVVLANTTCDYQKAFLDNLKKNQCKGGSWYKTNLPKDLKSIAEVYSKLNNHADKSKLLHIACGISRLPFYTNTVFYIKLQYWSCTLLQFKKKLGDLCGNQLICSLEWSLNYDVKIHCWTSEYSQDKIDLDKKTHNDFDTYLKNFNDGLIKYKCKSESSLGFSWYKEEIQENIKGLQKVHLKIESKELKKEVCHIGCQLSKSYKLQKLALLFHYLFYQNRLIRLKNLVRIMIKNDIHYNSHNTSLVSCYGWYHSKSGFTYQNLP